jgi:sugar/nucleoside kinase (ribokinase family)
MNTPPKPFQFAVLGNAVVDAIAPANDALLAAHKLMKGDSNVLSHPEMLKLTAAITVQQFRSGGSAANTAYTLGKLGARVCFIGKIGQDPTGRHFAADLVQAGVTVTPGHANHRTGEVFVLLTPDGLRTMAQTQPAEPSPDDAWVDESLIEQSACLVLGAYATGSFPAATAFAATTAAKSGAKLVLSLASPKAVQGAANLLTDLILSHHPLVIGNQSEWATLLSLADPHTAKNLEKTPRVITRSGNGATYFDGQGLAVDSPTQAIPRPADMTGAGDAFAAGFLHTFMGGGSPQLALQHGHQLGRAMVLQLGPRLLQVPSLATRSAEMPHSD